MWFPDRQLGSVLVANDPIENILQNAETMIESMTSDGGYNFDWGTATIWDETKQTSPACYVDFNDEREGQKEADSCAFLNHFTMEITLFPKLTTESDTPRRTIRGVMTNMITDIKKLFGTPPNNSINGTCDAARYKGFKKINPKSNDYIQSYQCKVFYDIQYQQNRESPMIRV